jgi:ABC-2 type transport system ATP-binding protein
MENGQGVSVVDLAKDFGPAEVVRGVSFEVQPGETFGLLGPNGAGKTTTLSMLSTLLPPTRGDGTVFGHSLEREAKQVRRLVGLAPQQISLYPDLSGEENLHFFGRLYGLGKTEVRRRSEELLDLVGLMARRRDRVAIYSGGMQRRLNLACSLIHAPRLLLLDEPTVGVDPQSRDNLFRAIEHVAASGTTVIYTTHYMEEAERLCDRIAILDEGRIIAMGNLDELLQIVGMGEIIEIRGVNLRDEALAGVAELLKVERSGDTTRIFVQSAARAIDALAQIVGGAEGIRGIEIYPVDLERVFMHLTGRALRD